MQARLGISCFNACAYRGISGDAVLKKATMFQALTNSPSVVRKNLQRRNDDENRLILPSPTDSESNAIMNGNDQSPDVGFSLPKLRKPLPSVVQSLRSSKNKNYSELGSCPTLNTGGTRPLLARTMEFDPAVRPVEEMVQTPKGTILVARQGDPRRPAIITYHDLALNYLSNFQTFFNTAAMAVVLDTFCIYHVTAPGLETGAPDLPEDFVYPNMDELSEQVEYILHYYGIPHCVGFGCGLGANVLVRFAHRRPTMVDGLVLVNCNSQNAGWVEWVYHKVNIKNLKKQTGGSCSLPDGVIDYLTWYHLGRQDIEGRSLDAVSLGSIYRQHFATEVNAHNLAQLFQSYMARTDLGLTRELAPNGKSMYGSTKSLQTPVLNMTGDYSPHVEATVTFNGRLQPNKCTWMKIQDAGMILEEKPGKVAEAVKLFLLGLGYPLRTARKSQSLHSTPQKLPKPVEKKVEDLLESVDNFMKENAEES